MRRLLAIAILVFPGLCFAETVSITITAPTQQVTVQKESTVIAPQSVTENVIIRESGTGVVTVGVPGPQGPATGAFTISPIAPDDQSLLWIDSSLPPDLVMKVYYSGSWVSLASNGIVPPTPPSSTSNPTYNDGSSIYYNDGSLL